MSDLNEKVGAKTNPAKSNPTRFDALDKEYRLAKTYRDQHVDPNWQEVVELVLPEYSEFGTDAPWEDNRYDSVGTEALTMLADGMFGNLTPSSQMWFRYQFADSSLNKGSVGGQLLDDLTEHMVGVFNRSTYYDAGPEFLQIGAGFGPSCLDIHEDKTDEVIVCRNENPRSVYVVENSRGQVRVVFTRRYYRPSQAVEEFGREALPDATVKLYDSGNDDTEDLYVESVRRNENFDPTKTKEARYWAFVEEVFIPGDSRKVILRTTYARTFSKPTWRWKTRAGNPYGWSCLANAMPDIRTANQIVRTWLMNLQRAADPATWDPEEGRSWSRDPGSRNYYKDPNRRGFKDDVPSMTPHIESTLEFVHQRVRQALKVDAFLMLMQLESQMTAREIVERKREGMTVVSATLGKFETEGLDLLHARFLSIEAAAGRLPEIPDELKGKQLKVEYLGPISQMQREIYIEQGIISALEAATPIFTLWPETRAKITPSLLIDRVWRANAAPEDALRTDKQYQDVLQKQAEAAAAAEQKLQASKMGEKIDPNMKPQAGSMASKMTGGE